MRRKNLPEPRGDGLRQNNKKRGVPGGEARREPPREIRKGPSGNPREGLDQKVQTVECGGALLSHTLSSAVPSPCQALASGFGKGPGVSPGP